ncbi:hypothetical protein GXW73_01065 [Roseomonas hellenica]|nr:hypothetical protein [Plastoroseomonas hellenica]
MGQATIRRLLVLGVPPPGPPDWPWEMKQRLRTLWTEGLPTKEIGRRLGTTKNAVIGQVHRMGLPRRESPIRGGPRGPRLRH